MENWLNARLKQDVRNTFEPRYGRELLDSEVIEIAESLASAVEIYTKFKQRSFNIPYDLKLRSGSKGN